MGEAKTIFCPQCKRKVAHYDGKSTINVIVNCQKCRKRVVYHINTDTTEIKDIPLRHCSSGKCFS